MTCTGCSVPERDTQLSRHLSTPHVVAEYALTILSECAAFPRRLIFFVKGSFTVRLQVKLNEH